MSNNNDTKEAAEISQFKFGIIAPVVQGLFTDSSRTAYYKRVTQEPLRFPDGTEKRVSYKTVEKWVTQYQHYGIDALIPSVRSDKGSSRSLPDTAIEEIYRLKSEFPRINATQIHTKLVEDGFIKATVSVSAVQRFIKRNDLKSARNPTMQDRKAFEEDSFGKMWQTDTCHFPPITENGESRKVYAVCIIDDHSRLITNGALFYADTAANFQSVFKQAVSIYGIPAKLYTDNGAPFANEQLSLICGAIGTVLLHTKVRDGASKAKIERFWRTCKETWLYTLDVSKIHSLEDFNSLFREFIRTYNTSKHSGIGCTPIERYRTSKNFARTPKSAEWLDESFLNRITRLVRKDSTVSIDRISYDVPPQFIGQRVDIRFRPGEIDSAVVLFEGKRYPIVVTNKNDNCRMKRNNPVSIDYSKIGGGNGNV